jgi:glycosyltransferase involved in cell wall biosynthesis
MPRILLSAYACEPGRGSEPGVGWSWATELARQGHEVTVVTRAVNRPTIELHIQWLPNPINFIYYDLPAWLQRVRRFPGGKQLYYVLWQWFAARMMRRCFPRLPFDVVQHVTYVSVRYPSFMGSLGIPFYFGPVSGGEAVPPALRSGFPAGEQCREILRELSNRWVRIDPLMRRTFQQASRILVTRDTLPLLPRDVRHKATQTLAVGVPRDFPRHAKPAHRNSGFRLLYVGRLLDWKGVDIALHAVSLARQRCPHVTITIVGAGPAERRLHTLGRELGLNGAVHWAGWEPQSQLPSYYQNSDVFIFPSLRDSGGMVVLEALAFGVPVLCTDLGGPGLIVNQSCGRAIAAGGRTRQELARAFSDALLDVICEPGLRVALSRTARLRATRFSFERLVRSVFPRPSSKTMEHLA